MPANRSGFNARKIAAANNVAAPAITGTAAVLEQAVTTPGNWSSLTNVAPTYQWKRNGVAVPGATGRIYYFDTADIGTSITCTETVTGTNGVSTTATSNAITGIVEATPTVSKPSVEASPTAPNAASVALINSNPRWKNDDGGTEPRVLTYSFPTAIGCYGDISLQAYIDQGLSPAGLSFYDMPNPWDYAFTITSGTTSQGDVYTNNGQTFKITSFASGKAVAYASSATPLPLSSGTLTKTSGSGSATLTYSAYIGFEVATTQEKTNVRSVLSSIERLINVHFVEVTETPGDTKAVLRFANCASFATTLLAASGEVAGRNSGRTGGDVWLNKSLFNFAIVPGSFTWMAITHEIGHTLGTDHPFSSSPPLNSALDWIPYTVMTYKSFVGDSNNNWDNAAGTFPGTFMGEDIRAFKWVYGANPRWKPNGVTYKFLPTGEVLIDGVSQGTPVAAKLLMTVIESSNGNDTYDFSAFSSGSVTQNVGDGTWMTLPGLLCDMANGSTHPAPGCIFFEYGLNPVTKTVILP